MEMPWCDESKKGRIVEVVERDYIGTQEASWKLIQRVND